MAETTASSLQKLDSPAKLAFLRPALRPFHFRNLSAPFSMLLTRRLYYHLKPFLPYRLRIAMRRLHVQRILKRSNGDWPIKKGSERPPDGWPGWPAGKRFAVVLTHDVESQRGVDRVKQLAELEMELGFRSCV